MSIAGGAAAFLETDDLERALSALAYGPRSPRQLWRGSNAALGFCDEGAVLEDAGSAVALSGTIDNRDELIAALDAAQDTPDAQLLLLAYRRWGEDFLRHVYGELTCAVWDADARRLLLGRDALGQRPLFYWCGPGEILFASEPRGLWAHAKVEKRLNDAQIGVWLAMLPHEGDTTLFEGILRVQPGCMAIWDGQKARTHRYWRPEETARLRLPRDEDYVEALRAELEAAIRRRIPAHGEIGCHLSAGLDSSTVAVLAARQLAGAGRRLTAFTAVPGSPVDERLRPDRIANEGPGAAAVARLHANMDHVLVANDASPVFDTMQKRIALTDWPVLSPSNEVWSDAIAAEAKRRGISVLLTGERGNTTISHGGWRLLPGLAKRGRFIRLARALWALRREEGHSWVDLLKRSFSPLLPTGLRARIRRLLGIFDHRLYGFSALNPAFAQESGIEARALKVGGNLANIVGDDGLKLRLLSLNRMDHVALMLAATKRLTGVTMADPTFDRRVVELCLAIPEEQYLHRGRSRAMVRRMMAGLLPEATLREPRKGLQAADWHVGFKKALAEFAGEIDRLEHSPMASRCLDIPKLKRLVEDWPTDGLHEAETLQAHHRALGRGLSMGHFIRRIEGGNY